MPAGEGQRGQLRWRHDALPYEGINHAAVAENHTLFYMLATASFVEITTDLYTRNLIDYYDGDDEVQGWLDSGWEPEELQHGTALRRYIAEAWPDFDWEAAYERFFNDYRNYCRVELLGPTRALEMARRCIVEMGTCSYYTMIMRVAPCPVLRELADNIRTDEASHYRHFHSYFLRYRREERPSRASILKALAQRIREIDGEDGFIAFKHVWLAMNPGRRFTKRHYRRFGRLLRKIAVGHYPFRMAVHMASQPLGFSRRTQRYTDIALAGTARLIARLI